MVMLVIIVMVMIVVLMVVMNKCYNGYLNGCPFFRCTEFVTAHTTRRVSIVKNVKICIMITLGGLQNWADLMNVKVSSLIYFLQLKTLSFLLPLPFFFLSSFPLSHWIVLSFLRSPSFFAHLSLRTFISDLFVPSCISPSLHPLLRSISPHSISPDSLHSLTRSFWVLTFFLLQSVNVTDTQTNVNLTQQCGRRQVKHQVVFV